MLVDNEPGVLARVIGLFSGRGYNLDSLTVSETEHQKHLSRITIATRGTPHVLLQIKHQLERLVPVHRVNDLTVISRSQGQEGPLERELALVKVAARATASRRFGCRSVQGKGVGRDDGAFRLRNHWQEQQDRSVHFDHAAIGAG